MRISDWSSDVCSSDLPIAVTQVVARRGGENHRFLRHHRDARADVGGVGFGQRHPVEQDLSGLRIVETFGELEERRLTGARGADNRHGLARVDCEAEIMQRRGIGTCRSEEHTSELQSLMRSSYAVFCLKKKK